MWKQIWRCIVGKYDKQFQQLNRNPKIAQALKNRAEKIRVAAQRISDAEGGTAHYRVVSGVRPGGRAYAYVVSDNRDEEFGTQKTKRIGALRRAARGG